MTASKSHPPSRRDVVSAGGATLAVAASSPAIAKSSQADEERPALRDPKDKYPNPPFERQSQPWPGLAGRMTPRPDHGESSYRGSGRLAGRKALVTGGDSGMGAPRRSHSRARVPMSPSIIYPRRRRMRGKSLISSERRAGRDCPFPATFGMKLFAGAWSTRRSEALGA
jgi:hypothetical protein